MKDYLNSKKTEILWKKGYDGPYEIIVGDNDKNIRGITYQEAQDWLREKHKLFVCSWYNRYTGGGTYSGSVICMKENMLIFESKLTKDYYRALDRAIKEALHYII